MPAEKDCLSLHDCECVCVCVSLSFPLSDNELHQGKKDKKSSFTVNYIFLYVQKVTPKLFLENPSIAFIYKYMYNTGSWAFENRIIDMNVQRHMDSNVRQCQGHW